MSGRGLTFRGDDRFMSDYLRSEILDRVSPAEASFLTRTSILEGMSGPLCDATLEASGSARVLEQLEERNLLVLPLDHRREWYRYHHLFRDLLASELARREPDIVPELHRRAAAWYEANGMPEIAIEHAQAAVDADTVARLVLQLANPVWSGGRADTVLRWMTWFDDQGLVESYPGIAVHGCADVRPPGAAHRDRALGRGGEARPAHRHAGRRQHHRGDRGLPAGAAVRATAWPPCGPTPWWRWPASSPPAPTGRRCCTPRASPTCSTATSTGPTPCWSAPTTSATTSGLVPFVPVLLAERGIIALERDEWADAAPFAEEADGHHAGRPVRRLLDQRAGLRLAGPGGAPAGERAPGPGPRGPGRPPPAPAHLRAAGGVGPGAAGDGPGLRHPGRRRGRPGGAAPGPGHPPAAAGPRALPRQAEELQVRLDSVAEAARRARRR